MPLYVILLYHSTKYRKKPLAFDTPKSEATQNINTPFPFQQTAALSYTTNYGLVVPIQRDSE